MRNRDTEGETVEECVENLNGISDAATHFTEAHDALTKAVEGYLSNVTDREHQWFDEIGAPVHEFGAEALKKVDLALRQLERFKAVWQTRLEIAEMEDNDDHD